jgi:hypothetical protein
MEPGSARGSDWEAVKRLGKRLLWPKSWPMRGVAVLIVAFAAYMTRGMGCAFWVMFVGPTSSTFDAHWWHWNVTCSCTPIRQQMAPDIVDRNLLDGLTRRELLELLGKPHPQPRAGAERPFLAWRLGQAPGILDDSQWLVVEFDDADHVVDAQLRVD